MGRRRFVLLASVFVACAQPSTTSSQPPATILAHAQPRPLTSSVGFRDTVEGHVAVVDMWAIWCEPCRESVPKVVRLYEAYKDAGLVVAGVHVGEGVDQARAFADDYGITYPLFADDDFAFSDQIGSRSVPTLLVLNRDGRVIHRGRELDADVLQLIRAELETSAG